MYCSFKRINSKTLSLITAIKSIYPKDNIQFKLCKEVKVEKLVDQEKDVEISGTISILNYLSANQYTTNNLEHFFWIENSLVDKQEMKGVKFS